MNVLHAARIGLLAADCARPHLFRNGNRHHVVVVVKMVRADLGNARASKPAGAGKSHRGTGHAFDVAPAVQGVFRLHRGCLFLRIDDEFAAPGSGLPFVSGLRG